MCTVLLSKEPVFVTPLSNFKFMGEESIELLLEIFIRPLIVFIVFEP